MMFDRLEDTVRHYEELSAELQAPEGYVNEGWEQEFEIAVTEEHEQQLFQYGLRFGTPISNMPNRVLITTRPSSSAICSISCVGCLPRIKIRHLLLSIFRTSSGVRRSRPITS